MSQKSSPGKVYHSITHDYYVDVIICILYTCISSRVGSLLGLHRIFWVVHLFKLLSLTHTCILYMRPKQKRLTY